ncbi:MAG: homogentisate 1,2-dioxygenase [Alphaproteobacteria bacterium]|nr:homogentisate 1,2-dioxygenase [Alphaproteobacteria bacterium]
MRKILFAIALFFQPLPVWAAAPAACPAMDKALPAPLVGWTKPVPLTAATRTDTLEEAVLTLGHSAHVRLQPTRSVHYAVQPDKPGGSVSHGGLLAITIAKPGTYQVSLGSGAWVDVVEDGKKVVSSAHGHGPACSTIRKAVAFPLKPGRHVIQISANADAALAIMVTLKP